MAVPPVPVRFLIFFLEVLEIDVGHVPAFEPVPVRIVFDLIPIVIILMVGIVNASYVLVVVLILLRRRHSKSADWRQQCGREKQRRDKFVSTMHSFSSSNSPIRMRSRVTGLE